MISLLIFVACCWQACPRSLPIISLSSCAFAVSLLPYTVLCINVIVTTFCQKLSSFYTFVSCNDEIQRFEKQRLIKFVPFTYIFFFSLPHKQTKTKDFIYCFPKHTYYKTLQRLELSSLSLITSFVSQFSSIFLLFLCVFWTNYIIYCIYVCLVVVQ